MKPGVTHSNLISRDCNPGHQFVSPLSVDLGQRLQAFPSVVIFASLNPASRQKQTEPVGKITVCRLHLSALRNTPGLGAIPQ
jgi:hypothetical protein